MKSKSKNTNQLSLNFPKCAIMPKNEGFPLANNNTKVIKLNDRTKSNSKSDYLNFVIKNTKSF